METLMSVTKTAHVAVIAFPFTSHSISLHSLVVRLARSSPNTHFTFLNTPTSNASLFNKIAQLPPNLKPYDLHDGVADTEGRNPLEISYFEAIELFLGALLRPGSLKAALDGAAAAAGAAVSCMLVNASLVVFLREAGELLGARVPWIAVFTAAPWLLSAYVHADAIRQRCAAAATIGDADVVADPALDFVPGLAGMRVSDAQPREMFLGNLEERFWFLEALSRLGQALSQASAVVLSSFRELNPDDLNHDMESKFHTLLNVGFLTVSVPPPPLPHPNSDPTGCLAWLDGQKARSVVYISFGTAIELSENEIKATAEALEESGISFLWSIRDHLKRLLPSEFAEKTRQRGKMVEWTNQVQVLGHGSVGVHVSHCGYNAVSESIANGVPIIGRPFWGDNQMNARMVESVWGIGVRLQVLAKNELIEALRMVLEQEEGKRMRERALALKKLVLDASSPSGSGTTDFNALLGLLSAL